MSTRIILSAVLVLSMVATWAAAQQATSAEPLSIVTTTLPKAYLRQPYRMQLEAKGGISPLRWEVTRGNLPPGVAFDESGVLSGIPAEAGEFHFTVTVTDGGRPAQQRSQDLVLNVVAPLLAQWSEYPKVSGKRIEGALKVSNQTDDDFDLTIIALAINEMGRATAIGYQHFTLKSNTYDLEIPLGDNLPPGAYDVNVDVVAEVAKKNTIYRTRLVSNEKLKVQEGP